MEDIGEGLLSLNAEGINDLEGSIWTETKMLWRIAFPSMIFRVTTYGLMLVTLSFVGHINQVDLAAYALIQTILVLFVNGILVSSFFSFTFY